MIKRILTAIINGFNYAWHHPQIIFILLFMIVIPVMLVFVVKETLDAGRANQDRLQKDRVGIMQDSFVAILKASEYDPSVVTPLIDEIARNNPDITKFRITKREGDKLIPVSALDEQVIGVPEEEVDSYRLAGLNSNESVIVPFYVDGDRVWQTFRYAGTHDGEDWYVFTEQSLAAADTVLEQNERSAWLLIIPVFVFIFLLAYWQFRNTDYRYLYLQAEEANKTRDLFTNMITHELRAPLTAMRGYASMIEENADASTENRQYGTRIRQSAERLLSIVNDLLEVARIQSGRLKVDFKPTDLSELIQNVVFELKPSANQKSISVDHSGTEAPVTVVTDEQRVHQILVNLVSNAVKYTEKGKIEISLTKLRKGVEIRVKDTGMGISAEDQKKLFAPFYRVESESVDQITGTGLGMWITKQLIEILGGSVGVESIKGVGTNVVIKFPEQPGHTQASKKQ